MTQAAEVVQTSAAALNVVRAENVKAEHRASYGAGGAGVVLRARPETASGAVMAGQSAGHDDDH